MYCRYLADDFIDGIGFYFYFSFIGRMSVLLLSKSLIIIFATFDKFLSMSAIRQIIRDMRVPDTAEILQSRSPEADKTNI